MKTVTPNLSDQQRCFCDEYLVSFNAYRAAINAGYSENTARKGELLHTPKIQDYLRLKMQQRGQRLEITHDMILRELAKIAFSNMGNYYDETGSLRPMCELSESDKAAISQYQIMDALDADGNRVGELCKIKLHNKMSALDKIARHLGFYGVERKSGELGVVSGESGLGSPESGVLGGELAGDDGLVETVPEAGVLHQGVQLEYLEAEHGNITDKTDHSDKNEVMVFADEVTAGVEKILTLSPLYGDGYGVTIDLPDMANEPIVGDELLIAAG